MNNKNYGCPKCEHENMTRLSDFYDGNEAWIKLQCNDCEHQWYEIYKFDRIKEA